MLKVRVNCPVCGQAMFAKSLEGHLERVHELTGTVTLRLHPANSYTHTAEQQPEPEEGPEPEKRMRELLKPEPEPVPEPEKGPPAEGPPAEGPPGEKEQEQEPANN